MIYSNSGSPRHRRASGKGVMSTMLTAFLCVAMSSANADVIRVGQDSFNAGAGLIEFDEFALGTQNPSYAPSDYGGGPGSPEVDFGGFYEGERLSDTPGADCPGAAATACIVGAPDGPLALDPDAPDVSIVADGANPTSPVLAGTPIFDGPIAAVFSEDQFGVGFDGGFFNAVASTGITAFDRQGNELGTVTNNEQGIEFLGLVDEEASIAGVALDLVGEEPAGFAIDNVRFGERGDVDDPEAPEAPTVPAPAPLALMVLGLFGLGAARHSQRQC